MSDPHVYDKAKWHYEGDFPKELPCDQAFVHTGMFLGWLIEHNMIDGEFAPEADRFRSGELTGAQVYQLLDGVLLDELLTEEGNRFARAYFDLRHGQFVDDYAACLAGNLPSVYHVADTRENYERIKARIEERYEEWKSPGTA